MDDELADVDRAEHAYLFAAAPILRAKLDALQAEATSLCALRRLRVVTDDLHHFPGSKAVSTVSVLIHGVPIVDCCS